MLFPDKARLFDALFDEEEFLVTLEAIAAAIGARSFLGGFAFHDGTRALNVSSGYWSEEQTATYYADFFAEDPWNRHVLANWKPARVADPGRHMSAREIEWSRLYQDFFRPMGDDTFQAISVPTEYADGIGAISFQRGRGQPDFAPEALDRLDELAPDLARVMALRGKLQGMEQAILTRGAALDALSDGMILLTDRRNVVLANGAAERVLQAGRPLAQRQGRLECPARQDQRALEHALAQVHVDRFAALRIGPPGAELDISLLALPPAAGQGRVLLAFPARSAPDRLTVLRQLYRLSAGEAEIALMLTDGLEPADIAAARGTSLNTVRAQLRTIGEKMECRRLIDIVRRVAALPRLGNFAPYSQ